MPLRKYIGYLRRRCVSKCYAANTAGNFSNAIVGNSPIGTPMWVVQYQRKEPQELLMQWFGLLSVAYDLRKTQVMEERSK